ncbi:MAG TPA: aminoglycoside phosphotransferase family protein [Trebonia sp.]
MTVKVPGKLVGAGRNADVYDVGNGRVLRRYRDGREPGRVATEAQVMTYARAHGAPVPEVFDVSGSDIVMERAAGPTMLDAIARRPWTVRAQARLLAELHDLVHQVPVSGVPGLNLPAPFGTATLRETDVLLHRDLHPQNVVLTEGGPVIIDWEGAVRGPAVADVGMTWVIIGFSDIPGPRWRAVAARGVQAVLTRSFLRAAGPLDDAWRLTVIQRRLADPNLLPSEAARLRKLVPEEPLYRA